MTNKEAFQKLVTEEDDNGKTMEEVRERIKNRTERSYTEEDMRKAWIYGRANYESDTTFEQWLKSTKNK